MKKSSSSQSDNQFGRSLSTKVFAGIGILTWVVCKRFLDDNPGTAHLSFSFKMFIGMICGLPFGMLAVWVDRSRARKKQVCRDVTANQILDDVLEGRVTRFSLYLRPFYTTGLLETDQERFPGLSQYITRAGTEDFETQLAQLVPADEPLVGLGRPGEAIGAGRIETDDKTWQANLDLLAKNAEWIYLLPLDRPGTIWEVDYIRSNSLLHKTTFLMPPSKSFNLREKWNLARNACRGLGIRLPEYQEGGGIYFRVSQEGISYAHAKDLKVAREALPPENVNLRVTDDPPKVSSCPKCSSQQYRPLTPEKMLGEAAGLVECEHCHTQYMPLEKDIPLVLGLAFLVSAPVLGSLLVYGFRTNEWRDLLSPQVAIIFLVGVILTIALPIMGGCVIVDWVLRKSNIRRKQFAEAKRSKGED